MKAVENLSPETSVKQACQALGLSRAAFYRRKKAATNEKVPKTSPRALSEQEKQQVLELCHSDRFIDKAPQEIYATSLDEGVYVCSVRTFYRILAANKEVKERRNQLSHPIYHKPELLATAPNCVWSWDITKLMGPVKWSYFYLYVILDIYSRYVVGWMLAPHESAALAERLIEQTCQKQGIQPGQLTIHADRGSSMTSKPVAFLLADLGITKTHSRPYTSNDNPFSESQFKTLKYCPDFPSRFSSMEEARSFCQNFFHWYNHDHRHTGISLLTPEIVHHGKAQAILEARKAVLEKAYKAHPERFVRGVPSPAPLPQAVWINPPATGEKSEPVAP